VKVSSGSVGVSFISAIRALTMKDEATEEISKCAFTEKLISVLVKG